MTVYAWFCYAGVDTCGQTAIVHKAYNIRGKVEFLGGRNMCQKAKGINAISTHFYKTDFNRRKAAMEKNPHC